MYQISGIADADVRRHQDAHNDAAEMYEILEPTESAPAKTTHDNSGKEMRETMVEVDLNGGETKKVEEHEVVVLEPWWETEYMGVAVGVLVTVILVLIVIIVFILYKNYKSGEYPESVHYYDTRIPPKFDHPEAQWPERKLTIGRKLPPTPTTSEEHYTDSSAEYSSPLLTQSSCGGGSGARQQPQQIYLSSTKSIHPDWETFFPCPPPPPVHTGTPPRLAVGMPPTSSVSRSSGYMKPVSHYAATDVISTSSSGTAAKIYGKGGTTYYL